MEMISAYSSFARVDVINLDILPVSLFVVPSHFNAGLNTQP